MNPNNFAKKIGVKFGDNCLFRTKNFGSEPYLISIGNNFETASNVSFVTHDGGVGVIRNIDISHSDIDLFKEIIIGNNVFIGLNSIILPGTVIEDNVIVGAGSIVKGQLKKNSIYAGVPVKYIKSLEEYKLQNIDLFLKTFHYSPEIKKDYLIKHFNTQGTT